MSQERQNPRLIFIHSQVDLLFGQKVRNPTLLGEWPTPIDRPGTLEQVKPGLEAALRGSFFTQSRERHDDPSDQKMKTAPL
jgi:hypothetical protein